MKIIQFLMVICGVLTAAGCRSYSSGTGDQYDSSSSMVPGRPDGIHTYPGDTVHDSIRRSLPPGDI